MTNHQMINLQINYSDNKLYGTSNEGNVIKWDQEKYRDKDAILPEAQKGWG